MACCCVCGVYCWRVWDLEEKVIIDELFSSKSGYSMMLAWSLCCITVLSFYVSQGSNYQHNLTIVGVNFGHESNAPWFIRTASNVPHFVSSNGYLSNEQTCQIRIFIIGLENIQKAMGTGGSATVMKQSEPPYNNCVYVTDKYYKVSNIKVEK